MLRKDTDDKDNSRRKKTKANVNKTTKHETKGNEVNFDWQEKLTSHSCTHRETNRQDETIEILIRLLVSILFKETNGVWQKETKAEQNENWLIKFNEEKQQQERYKP